MLGIIISIIIYIYTYIWRFPEIGVPLIIHFNGIFHNEPSILRSPHLRKPNIYIYIFVDMNE